MGGQTILIDPGHGGSDPGAVAGGVYEKDLNLQIAQLIRVPGWDVYLTRVTDKFVSLADRRAMSNNLKPDLFISIHCDSWKTGGPNGITIFVEPRAYPRTIAAAAAVHESIKRIGATDRGVKRAKFTVLTSGASSMLIECGFISNPAERAKLQTHAYRAMLARAIIHGIQQWVAK